MTRIEAQTLPVDSAVCVIGRQLRDGGQRFPQSPDIKMVSLVLPSPQHLNEICWDSCCGSCRSCSNSEAVARVCCGVDVYCVECLLTILINWSLVSGEPLACTSSGPLTLGQIAIKWSRANTGQTAVLRTRLSQEDADTLL